MKVIVEAEKIAENQYVIKAKDYGTILVHLSKNECEPVQEGWLTEEQFGKIRDLIDNCTESENCVKRTCRECDLDRAKKLGYVKSSKTARQELEEYINKIKLVIDINGDTISGTFPVGNSRIKELIDKAIQEAEKK
jgi:hypothetical protein